MREPFFYPESFIRYIIKEMKKLFGGIELTWKKVILSAILAGIVTAIFAIVPLFHNTSFEAVTVTPEVWIFFGILIIMNGKSNMDSALKCFVFFLISQPLVYLIQVPFSSMGWGLFNYYRYWFLWTLLCFPMGYIGYWMKKDRWWGYLILFPMIVLTASSYLTYFSDFLFSMPRFLLICLFCVAAMILYPVLIFKDMKIRRFGGVTGAIAVFYITFFCLMDPPVYSVDFMPASEENYYDDSYQVSLEDDSYGDVDIRYSENTEDHILHAGFKKAGDTILTLIAPDGEKTEYELHIERNSFRITKKQ